MVSKLPTKEELRRDLLGHVRLARSAAASLIACAGPTEQVTAVHDALSALSHHLNFDAHLGELSRDFGAVAKYSRAYTRKHDSHDAEAEGAAGVFRPGHDYTSKNRTSGRDKFRAFCRELANSKLDNDRAAHALIKAAAFIVGILPPDLCERPLDELVVTLRDKLNERAVVKSDPAERYFNSTTNLGQVEPRRLEEASRKKRRKPAPRKRPQL